MHLDKILIKNFRAIEELELELGKINIVVGRNNTGKTSLLEAIILFLASMYDRFEDPIFNRNMLEYISQLHGGFNSLFRSSEEEISISSTIASLTDNSRIEMELKIIPGNRIDTLDTDIVATLKQELLIPVAEEELKEKIVGLERRINELEGLKRSESIRVRRPGIEREIEKLERYKEELAYLKENFELATHNLADSLLHYDVIIAAILIENSTVRCSHIVLKKKYAGPKYISSTKKLSPIPFYYRLNRAYPKLLDSLDVIKKIEVIEELRSKIPYFVDYRDGMIIFGYESNRKEKEVIPLEGASDGVKVLMELFPLGMLGIWIALLEESETHLHPGFMKRFAEELVYMAKEIGIQFIMTSHSIEFIEILMEHVKKEKFLDEIRIIRMYRLPSGEIDRETLRGEEAIQELEVVKSDLRGP